MATARKESPNRQFQGYYFTSHLLDRFEDRFGDKVSRRFPNLIWKDTRNIGAAIGKLLNESYVDDTFKNNTVFMINCWETHGYDRNYTFYVNKEYGIIFVLVEETKTNRSKFVATCMELSWFTNTNKTKKPVVIREKKREKYAMSDEEYYRKYVNNED